MGKQVRFSLLSILVVSALLFAGCYPFQGDVTLLLTPVPPGQVAAPTSAPAEEAAPSTGEAAQSAPTLTVTVNVNSLRVRQGPSTETPIVAGLRSGTAVTALGRTEDASWLQIQVPDVETQGWVAAEFVIPDGDVMALPVVGEGAVAEAPAPTAAPAEEPAAEPTPAPVEEPAPVEPVAGDAQNSVTVADQTVEAGTVTVAQVNTAQDGWIVIHADDAGTFGEVIGYAQVAAGVNENVVVEIDAARATPILYAMLHVDAGEPGVYEFPGPDGPVIVDGAPVSPTFQVELATAEQPAAEATPAPAEEPAAEATPAPAEEAAAPVSPIVVEGPTVTQIAQVNTRSLRVRSAPSLEAEVVAGAKDGEVYPVAGVSEDGAWVSIYFPGLDAPAWVSAQLVTLIDAPLTVHMGRARVNTGDGTRLRLRSAPSLEAEIIGRIPDGETVLTTGVSGDGEWVLLFVPEVAGPTWAAAQYLVLE